MALLKMNRRAKNFLYGQYEQIKKDPLIIIKKIFVVALYFPASVLFLMILMLRPIVIIRLGELISSRIGHFSANTELYLCEKRSNINTPLGLHVDFFYLQETVCNRQLLEMWSREITIVSKYTSIILARVGHLINIFSDLIPSLKLHIIKPSLSDRDIHDLLGKSPIHLKFNQNEKEKGVLALEEMGIPRGGKIILLYVRDSAYLESVDPKTDYSYHNYRDCDIDNFNLVAEKLAKAGYYVIRMGAHVQNPFKSSHSKVIDYAYNGLRTEFLDIYLSAVCDFVLSTGNGGEAPAVWNYRKPWVLVNLCPVSYFPTFMDNTIILTKHHIDIETEKELTFKEILSRNAGICLQSKCYTKKSIKLVENTPSEICEATFQMVEKLKGLQKNKDNDRVLQDIFWDIFPKNVKLNGVNIHGKIRATYGASFLRNNSWWLQ